MPTTREALEDLPGVGRKTANVVLNTAFGEPTMAVDTHIFRVSNRTRFAPGKNVLQVEKKLLKVIPDEFIRDAHLHCLLYLPFALSKSKKIRLRLIIVDSSYVVSFKRVLENFCFINRLYSVK